MLDPTQENVIGAAIMVVTAFRLSDHDALITALRYLSRTVHALEQDNPAAVVNGTPSLPEVV